MWTPYFYSCTSTRWRTRFLFKKIYFSENDLELSLIFVLFLKGKQNKKETINVTPYLENMVCEKPNMGSRVRLLIGNVR